MTKQYFTRSDRRSTRLREYDYSQCGIYFVTICAYQRECLFGNIVEGIMELNDRGRIVAKSWEWLFTQYEYLEMDSWVIMPNHFHGILTIRDNTPVRAVRDIWAIHESPLRDECHMRRPPPRKHKPLGRLIGAFKTVSTKEINLLRHTPGMPVWQRNYHDHVIRAERSLDLIREYIIHNPARWELDRNHPRNINKLAL